MPRTITHQSLLDLLVDWGFDPRDVRSFNYHATGGGRCVNVECYPPGPRVARDDGSNEPVTEWHTVAIAH